MDTNPPAKPWKKVKPISDGSHTDSQTFDWEAAKDSINLALTEMEQGERSPQAVNDTWSKRAAQLAQPLKREDTAQQIELVLIKMGTDVYGLPATHITTIRPVDQITRVPHAPGWAVGVANIRGRILPVINLASFLGLATNALAGGANLETGCLVTFKIPGMEAAWLVDSVLSVENLPTNKVRPASSLIHAIQPEYIQGLIEWESETGPQVVILLDLLILCSSISR